MASQLKPQISSASVRRWAFTLIELLVVIAIVGILVSLLLPAVQAAREAARRMQCRNNLKQLGLGLLNYESTYKVFPPSSHWRPADAATIDAGNHNRYSENWVILILPFCEEQALFDRFDLTKYITDAANASSRGTPLNVMRCPSDPYNDQPFNGSATAELPAVGDGWARGNYAANASLGAMNSPATCGNYGGVLNCAALSSSPGWKDHRMRGMMGANSSVTIANNRDGTSHTIVVAEVRAGVNAADPRGCWAMSGGPSSLWGHGSYMGDANGPNASGLGGDNVPSCNTLLSQAGCAAWNNCPFLEDLNMSCFPLHGNQEVCRSAHLGGVQVALADGSVHFIGDSIDTNGDVTASPPMFSVWDRLNLSADGQPISGADF